jgi:hypothetical protein
LQLQIECGIPGSDEQLAGRQDVKDNPPVQIGFRHQQHGIPRQFIEELPGSLH